MSSAKTLFQEMNLAPDVSFRIQIDPDVPMIQKCLMKCSKKEGCKSVVYGNQTCSQYSTTYGIHELTAGQKMVAMVSLKG
jgi:hypothetical protein